MCVLLLDADDRITVAGRDWRAFAGPDEAEPVGRSFVELADPAFRPLCSEALNASRSGGAQVVEFRPASEGDELWRATLAPFESAAGTACSAVFLCCVPCGRGRKDELVNRAILSVAHDLNNALTVIVGLNGLMQTGPVEAKRSLYTTEIGKAADRGTQLAAELLAFGRKRAQDTRVVGLNAVLAHLEPLLRRLVGPAVELTTSRAQGIAPVRASRAIVESLLVDLVLAEVSAMPDGGQLALKTSSQRMPSAEADPAADATAPGSHTVITVVSNGRRDHGRDAAGALRASVRAAIIECGAVMTTSFGPETATTTQILFPSASATAAGSP